MHNCFSGARSALRSFSDLALVRKPAPFVFRQYLKVYHSTLSKLGFMIQYETYIACRKKTDDRTSILSALHGKPQLMEDRCAMLRYSGTHNTFTLVKKLPKTLHIFKYESLSDTCVLLMPQHGFKLMAKFRTASEQMSN
jgi:hypothetical protein